jgi:hypothetical protein
METELKVLESICKDNDLSIQLFSQLLRSAEKFSYDNTSPSARRKDYLDLINYYSKNKGGQ